MDNVARFGPSGSDFGFAAAGYTSTVDMPKYINALSLDCFEYSFGQGVRLSMEKADEIGKAFFDSGLEISVHAPYFINFANPDEEKIANSFAYMDASLNALRHLGGKRCVVHPGSPLKAERETAAQLMYSNIKRFADYTVEKGYDDLYVCFETMGKINQMGSVDEIINAVNLAPNFLPCIDFGHVNARTLGGLKGYAEYEDLIKKLLDNIDNEKVKNMHVHFSKIQYGKSGEIRHLTFEDKEYGPSFEPLLDVFVKYGLTPYVACESAGTQAQDALSMKKYYKSKL